MVVVWKWRARRSCTKAASVISLCRKRQARYISLCHAELSPLQMQNARRFTETTAEAQTLHHGSGRVSVHGADATSQVVEPGSWLFQNLMPESTVCLIIVQLIKRSFRSPPFTTGRFEIGSSLTRVSLSLPPFVLVNSTPAQKVLEAWS
jgi:hypothetical protein